MPDDGDSLVLPIAPDCWPPPRHGVEIDGIAFTPKPELHITVIGSRLGRELREVFAAPWLRAALAAAFDEQDWRFTRGRRHWLLRKPFLEDGRLRVAHSIIERVELPTMAPLHRELGRLLGRQLPAPPPHVTLYVAGPPEGIGVSSAARLRAFAVREVSGHPALPYGCASQSVDALRHCP